eukprot:5628280-Prymnesium_polylepis.1
MKTPCSPGLRSTPHTRCPPSKLPAKLSSPPPASVRRDVPKPVKSPRSSRRPSYSRLGESTLPNMHVPLHAVPQMQGARPSCSVTLRAAVAVITSRPSPIARSVAVAASCDVSCAASAHTEARSVEIRAGI